VADHGRGWYYPGICVEKASHPAGESGTGQKQCLAWSLPPSVVDLLAASHIETVWMGYLHVDQSDHVKAGPVLGWYESHLFASDNCIIFSAVLHYSLFSKFFTNLQSFHPRDTIDIIDKFHNQGANTTMKTHLRLVVTWIVFSLLFLSLPGPDVQAILNPPPQWVSPLELDFGPVGVGSAATQRIVTITNSGSVPLTGWAGGAVNTPFSASQDCNIVGGVLPGHSCHYYFSFIPSAAGTFSATSSSVDSAGPINIIVHGTGVDAQATADAHDLDFGTVHPVKTFPGTAPTQTVTIKNTGLAPLTNWTGGGVGAPFSASQDCNVPGGLLPGASCHYYFGFSTATTGTFSATSSSSTNGGSITVNLSGAATLLIIPGGQQVTPRSLDFGPVGVGVTTAARTATITNQSGANITSWAGGGVSAPFNGSQDCNVAGGLIPGASCNFYYTFHPTSAGAFSATSNVSDSLGSFSVTLTGVGVAPSMRADSLWLDFGPQLPGVTAQQVVTITNTGLSNLTGWAGGGVSAPFGGSQDCNISGGVLPGHSCHFYYTYSPTAQGIYSTTSTFSTNAGSLSIKLQGETFVPQYLYLPAIER
jgi:hypothetical protein